MENGSIQSDSAELKDIPPRKKLFIPISFKLITMISLIVLASLSAVTVVATYFFISDNKTRAMEDTLNYSTLISKKVNSDLNSIKERAKLAAINLYESRDSKDTKQSNEQTFTEMVFERDPDMVFIGLIERNKPDALRFIRNDSFFKSKKINPNFKNEVKSEIETISRSFAREETVFNPSVSFNEPVIGISFPYDPESGDTVVIVYYSMNKILESMGTASIINSFIVSGNGDLIAHKDRELVTSKTNLSSMPIVRMMMTNANPNAQTTYTDENKNKHLGAFCRIGFADAVVVSYVKEELAFAMVYKIQRLILWLTGIVLSLSFLINLFFSRSLSKPIVKLTGASREIQKGNYDLDISSTSRDEIGILTNSFKDMAKGLAERERIKNAFSKFVNKHLAELVMNNDVKLGGERKDVAVFFSDIRSFTKISESLPPEEVVDLLNDYLTRMVECVDSTKGIVDKYIGDAVMAVWGAPIPSGDDAYNAVNASLMMREKLLKFNKDRGSVKKPVIQIGCGIHCGPVLAGQIGSDAKMEYTVIGDTVNTASRIEALNKAFFTDILISEETANRVKDRFKLCPMQKITVKGKSDSLQIYAVLGRLSDKNAPKDLDELRTLIGTSDLFAKSDSIKLNTYKEVKYEILG